MSNFVGCWNFIEEGGKEGEEKRRLDRKIFEGVEVILSSGAKKLVSFNWCCLQD